MMRLPDALPLHLMLAMMQSQSFPSAFGHSNNPFQHLLPDWMRPKSPLEQGLDQWQKLWNQGSEQLSQFANPFLSQNQSQSPFAKSKDVSSRVYPGIHKSPSSAAPAYGSRDKPGMTTVGDAMAEFWASLSQNNFFTELAQQSQQQTAGFFEGLEAYTNNDYTPPPMDYPVLWQRGSARLFDLAPDRTDAVAVLCVPSLINSSRVLDLTPDTSFVQYLKQQGFRPLILDWGTPGDAELNFDTADYITGYALDALRELRENHDSPIALVGYCMGGIFAVAMAQLAALFVDALVLLATPWDFSADDTPRVLLEPASQLMLRQWINMMNPVPPLVTQTVFHLIDPWRVQEKYSRFPTLSAEEKQHFLAVEQWVNDGVPLVQKLAEEVFVDWPQNNILSEHQWKVGRRWIEPASIACPTLAIIPQNDLIVPMGCALPLTKEIPRCDVLTPDAGHVSMVCGRRARDVMWQPLSAWLKRKF